MPYKSLFWRTTKTSTYTRYAAD